MEQETLAVLLGSAMGAGGAIGASLVAHRYAIRVQRSESRDRDRRAFEDAFVSYLGAVDAVVGQVFVFSGEPGDLNRLERAIERLLGPALEVLVVVVQRLLFGFRWERVLDHFYAANARLLVQAPEALREVMSEVVRLFASPNVRAALMAAPWRTVRRQLLEEYERAAKIL